MATLVTGSMVTDGSINATDIATGAIPTKLGSEIGSFGFRNRLINGDFKFDERSGGALVTYTGTAATSDLYRTADRWAIFGAGNQTQAQRITNTDTISFPTAMRIRRVNGSAQQTSLYLGQVIERANCTGLAGGPITLSFVARRGSTYSGTNNTIEAEIWTGTNTDDRTWWQHLNLQWENQARPLVQTPTLTTNWQTFSYTVNLPSNVQQIMVRFSAFQAGTSNPDDYIDIAQVQLEKGSARTPFEERPVATELALCQRYYFKQSRYFYDTIGSAYNNLCTKRFAYHVFGWLPVCMRTAPAILSWKISSWQDPNINASGNFVYHGSWPPYSILKWRNDGAGFDPVASGWADTGFEFEASAEL